MRRDGILRRGRRRGRVTAELGRAMDWVASAQPLDGNGRVRLGRVDPFRSQPLDLNRSDQTNLHDFKSEPHVPDCAIENRAGYVLI
jgi:hypothetical protein